MRLTLAGPTLKRCSNLFQTNLWQGSKLIAETDNDKHWQSYLYEPDSYRPLALVHGNAQQDNIKLYWYQNDHLGTPIALTGSLGDTLYECQYNAYGQIINETYHQDDIDSLPDNPLRFQGQYYDEETGLHYNLNRYYDPFTGRYITQDPIKLMGGNNLYQYCPNPVNWVDPLGLIAMSETIDFNDLIVKQARERQAKMLDDNIGYNISPFSWDKYPTIGRDGTFITDSEGIMKYFKIKNKEKNITITSEQASIIEADMGLVPGSLTEGFNIRRIENIKSMSPRSPLLDNEFFKGPGQHLPGGAPEMVINSIPTSHEILIKVYVK
jgi:RHS repeat-associated protein